MVAPCSAPHSSSAAITARPSPCRRCSGVHLDAAEADPVAVVRRHAARDVADPRGRPTPGVGLDQLDAGRRLDRRAIRRRDRRSAPLHLGHARDLEQRVGVVALRHPAVAAEQRVLGRVRAARPRSAGRRTRPPARRRRRRPAGDERQHRVGPARRSRWGSGAAASRPTGSVSRSGHSASPCRCASSGRDPVPDGGPRGHRLAGHDVGEPDPDRVARLRLRRRTRRRPTTCTRRAGRSSRGRRTGRSRRAGPGVRRPAGRRHGGPSGGLPARVVTTGY